MASSCVNLATPGHFEAITDAKTKFEPFMATSNRAMEIEAVKFAGSTPDIVGLLRDYKAGDKALVLAARVTGPISDGVSRTGSPARRTRRQRRKMTAAQGR